MSRKGHEQSNHNADRDHGIFDKRGNLQEVWKHASQNPAHGLTNPTRRRKLAKRIARQKTTRG